MINYTPKNQLSLDMFDSPFEQELEKENRWIKLSELVPWDDLANVYCHKLKSNEGRKSIDIRMVIGALIIKHKMNLDDRGTVMMIQENIYMQYFCGLQSFTTKRPFDPSLFVDIRKRLGSEEFDTFNRHVIERAEQIRPHQGRIKTKKIRGSDDDLPANKGTLKVDATVADQEIKYPTDLNLLNESRENLERIISLLHISEVDGKKPRTYCRKARKEYLSIAKKRRKSKRDIRRGLKQQLQYIRRDLKTANELVSKPARILILDKRDKQLLETIEKIYEQQKWMYNNRKNTHPDRIVSIHQPWVRPIVRGKEKNKTEFGSKINISEVDGFCRIDRLSWDQFNEAMDLENQVERFKDFYGCYPKVLLGDQIYLNRSNRKYLKEKNIAIYGKPLGRPPKNPTETSQQKYIKKKKAAKRNNVEGKFGQGKRGYGLNNIKARLSETSESWVNSIFFVMNLIQLVNLAEKYHYFSCLIFSTLKKLLKKIIWINFLKKYAWI